jgi:hypothetical protein
MAPRCSGAGSAARLACSTHASGQRPDARDRRRPIACGWAGCGCCGGVEASPVELAEAKATPPPPPPRGLGAWLIVPGTRNLGLLASTWAKVTRAVWWVALLVPLLLPGWFFGLDVEYVIECF